MNNKASPFHPLKTHSELETFWAELLDKLADVLDAEKIANERCTEANNDIS